MISRRHLLTAGLVTTAGSSLALTAGCGRNDAPSAGPASSSAPASAFPATVTHVFGTTTVPAAPQRPVSVGTTEQDTLLAFGAIPVGVTEWYGKQPSATWPWALPLYGDAKPTVLSMSDGVQFEKVAALAPDLIVGTNAGLTKEDYTKLSAIAPTIPHAGGYPSAYFEPWWVQTELVGAALGQPAKAAELIAGVRREFTDAAAANAQFAGKKAIFLQGAFYEGSAIASQAGLGTDFLTDLGFVIPKDLDAFVRPGEQAYVPLEKLSALDVADVLIWATDDPAGVKEREANAIYRRLEAVREGRSVATGEVLAAAIYFSTVLSLPMVVRELTPKLAAVLPR